MARSLVPRAAAQVLAAACLLVACGSAGLCGEIAVTVTDDLGNPVAGAQVQLSASAADPALPYEFTTDAMGKAAFGGLAPGRYGVSVRAPRHGRYYGDVTATAESMVPLAVRIPRMSRISGKVVLKAGQPLANAEVTVYCVQPQRSIRAGGVMTAADGSYSVGWDESGLYDAVLLAPRYEAVEHRDVQLTPGSEVTGVDFVLDAPMGSIAGVVYEPDGKTPKAGATVWVADHGEAWQRSSMPLDDGHLSPCPPHLDTRSGRRYVTTGPGGAFVLTDVRAGLYVLRAHAPGSRTSRPERAVVVGRSQQVAGVTIVLETGGAIGGTVYDANGPPLANAQLTCQLRLASNGDWDEVATVVTTDAVGSYKLDSLAPGLYSFELSRRDGAVATVQAEVEEGKTATADFRLGKGGSFTALLVNPDGTPAVQAEARLWRETEALGFHSRWPPRAADADGRVRFGQLPDGTYWVVASSAAKATARAGPVAVRAGEPGLEVRVALQDGATIRGEVVDQDGNPVAGAQVDLHWQGDRPVPGPGVYHEEAVRADAEGRFVLPQAAPSTWSLTATAPGHLEARVDAHVADQGEHDVRIALVKAWSGTLRGQILMPDGRTPVAGTPFMVDLLVRPEGREWCVGRERIRTDAQGQFSLLVDRAVHAARFVADDLTPTTIEIEPSQRATVAVVVRLASQSAVRGTIELADGPIPRDGLWVLAVLQGQWAVLPGDPEDSPRDNGNFTKLMPGQTEWHIRGLLPGVYDVFTYAPGLAPSVPVAVTVTEGETADAIVYAAPRPGAVSGRALTGDGRPVAGVFVYAFSSGGRIQSLRIDTQTDQQGRYRLEGLTPGPARIEASATLQGLASPPEQQTLLVPDETIESVDFELCVGGQVSGVVKRGDGKALTGEYSVALDMGPVARRRARVQPDGSFKFERVYPGTYDLSVQPYDPAQFELIAKQEGLTVADEQTVGGIEFVIEPRQ